MAFTSAQATSIRHYLGYPQVYRQDNPRLESAITTVGQDSDATALVVGFLANLAAVDAQILNVALVSTGVKSLDKGDVELYENHQQLVGLQKLGRMYASQLSDTMGVPIANDVYGSTGYSGDSWKMSNARPKLMGLG